MTKICFKCKKELMLSEFYKHPQMKDGVVGKCKECNKKDVQKNRRDKLDQYREYDRNRGSRMGKEELKKYRAENPEKHKAHSMVNYAKRIGLLMKQPCEFCGSTWSIHAHHDDYSNPLEVMWLCAAHHKTRHAYLKYTEFATSDSTCLPDREG